MRIDIYKHLPRFLFFFSIAAILTEVIIFIAFVFLPDAILDVVPYWFYGVMTFCALILIPLLLLSIALMTVMLLFLSIWLPFKRKLFLITIILSFVALTPFIFLGWSNHPASNPDRVRMADLRQVKMAEGLYFTDYQQYADYEELKPYKYSRGIIFADPETKQPYQIILSEDKQNFEAKAKLDKGGWYICNKDLCEKRK